MLVLLTSVTALDYAAHDLVLGAELLALSLTPIRNVAHDVKGIFEFVPFRPSLREVGPDYRFAAN